MASTFPPTYSVVIGTSLRGLLTFAIGFFSGSPSPGVLVPSGSFLAGPISVGGSKIASMPSSGRFELTAFAVTGALQLGFMGPLLNGHLTGKIYPPSGPGHAPPPSLTF